MAAAPPPPGADGAAQYRRLFAGYATGLIGTGVAVVGLTLVAFDAFADDAATVIATALSIKVFAYITAAPVAATLFGRAPKKPLLIGLDLIRAGAILTLPFMHAAWHLYAAVFAFTAASAAFTTTYQTLVPHLLPDPRDYARALAKSRIAGEIENAASPLIAALILVALTDRSLFVVAMAFFLASAACVAAARLPELRRGPPIGVLRGLALGPRLLLVTPGLRGLLPLHLVAAAGTAMVMVNSVVMIQGGLGLGGRAVAVAFAAFGLGSIVGAVAAPRLLRRVGERRTILAGCAIVVAGLFAGVFLGGYGWLLALWAALGVGAALATTPAPIALRRLIAPERHAQAYAALFGLANAALLAGYAIAGWVGAEHLPSAAAFGALGALAAAASVAVALAWPRDVTAPVATAPLRPRSGPR